MVDLDDEVVLLALRTGIAAPIRRAAVRVEEVEGVEHGLLVSAIDHEVHLLGLAGALAAVGGGRREPGGGEGEGEGQHQLHGVEVKV